MVGSLLANNKVWQSDFQHLLRIRFATHHSKCSLCIKHRLLVKKLGHCQAARNAQHAMLQKHLQRQQRDRQVYYAARARSRLCATTLGEIEICAILDSMDAQKHAWPRSRSMSSKEFSSFNRPRLASTTLLVHGHLVMVALSPSLITAGSSRTAELLCCGLTKMAARIDFRSVWLNLQADNCSKEVKNVGTLRLLSMWTALHKIAGAELSFLSSGHSHEDIDALFSLLRAHLERNPELWTPEAFKTCLEGFFACPQNRPNEPTRCVEMLSRYKDWNLICIDFPKKMWTFSTHTHIYIYISLLFMYVYIYKKNIYIYCIYTYHRAWFYPCWALTFLKH